jgi:hypothetical protein
VPSTRYWSELATLENALLAFEPTRRIVPTTNPSLTPEAFPMKLGEFGRLLATSALPTTDEPVDPSSIRNLDVWKIPRGDHKFLNAEINSWGDLQVAPG